MPSLFDPSPAYLAFQQQVANPQFGAPAPPVTPAQVAFQQPVSAPQAYPQTIPPWLLPGYDPPGMDDTDREFLAEEDRKRREKYQADLLAGRLDKATLWKGLKGAQFAQKALPFAFPSGFLADKFVPEGKVRSFLSGFNPFEHARRDEVAHRAALIRNQGFIFDEQTGGWYERQTQQDQGPGAVSDFVQVSSIPDQELLEQQGVQSGSLLNDGTAAAPLLNISYDGGYGRADVHPDERYSGGGSYDFRDEPYAGSQDQDPLGHYR
jgi:hypothetical protein